MVIDEILGTRAGAMRQTGAEYSYVPKTKSLRCYLSELDHIAMLSPDEEAELGFRIREGDESAVGALVEANLRFVVYVAKGYYARSRRVPFDDIVAAGNIGLVKAARKWDPSLGFRFCSFAVWRIRSEIDMTLMSDRLIKIPIYQIVLARKISGVKERAAVEGVCRLTDNEIADATGLSLGEILRVRESALTVIDSDNFERLSTQDADYLLCEQPEDVTPGYWADAVLSILTPRDASILRDAVGLDGMPVPPDDIADELNLSRERVRQLIAKSKRRLHSPRVREILIR